MIETKVPMNRLNVVVKALLLLLLVAGALGAQPDQEENCAHWAENGECDKNPGFMLHRCATSCAKAAAQALQDSEELKGISSFFELSARDIHGKVIDFSKFRGQVTILVNVASYCGYTDSHYRGLVKLWSHVKKSGSVNILAFPCNQFGEQEPESNEKIDEFALGYGVDFTMMDKIDVNGPNASLVYKYLKSRAGPATIEWNFATYFVVGPDGSMHSHSGIEPLELKDVAMGLLESDEL